MFRKQLIAGLLFWIPVGVTVLCVQVLIDLFISIAGKLPATLQPDYWFGRHIPGIEVILIILIIWLSGVLVANFFGRRVVFMGESMLERVPLIRSVYSGVKQVLQMMVKPNNRAFQDVVLMPFPQKGSWVIGLVTHVDESKEGTILTVFVPTTPNPTSGYVICVNKDSVMDLDMSVDEALKYIISLGTISHDALQGAFKTLTKENKK